MVEDDDVWNMDEKGSMQGVIAKLRVMLAKWELTKDGLAKEKLKKPHMTQCGNREWVLLLECVSATGQILKPWIIFKGKLIQKAWWDVLLANGDGHIALTENGWTNNEIGLAWVIDCFDPQTKAIRKGEWRMLLLDGMLLTLLPRSLSTAYLKRSYFCAYLLTPRIYYSHLTSVFLLLWQLLIKTIIMR